MEDTSSKHLLNISKSLWQYLFQKHITVTAKYLPNSLNIKANWESRHAVDKSEWKLYVPTFQIIHLHMGKPTIVLFASRTCLQLPRYTAWKPDPTSVRTDAIQHLWDKEFGFAFPSFSLITIVLRKVQQERVDYLIIVTPT